MKLLSHDSPEYRIAMFLLTSQILCLNGFICKLLDLYVDIQAIQRYKCIIRYDASK